MTKKKEFSPLDLAKSLAKEFGDSQVVMPGSDLNVYGAPSGLWALDKAIGTLGDGGFPIGRISEVSGDFATGKTLICHMALAQTQKSGGIGILIDAENALNPVWAKNLGIDMKTLQVLRPDTIEDAYDMIERAIETIRTNYGQVPLTIVWDSIPALECKTEKEKKIGAPNMGAAAKMHEAGLKRLNHKVARENVALILINKIYEKIGVMFGKPTDTKGGKGPKFWATLRLETRVSTKIKKDDVVVGQKGTIEVIKNRHGKPFQKVGFQIDYDGEETIGKYTGLFEILKKEGKIVAALDKNGKERKGYYNLAGTDDTITENTFTRYTRDNPEVMTKVIEDLEKELAERNK